MKRLLDYENGTDQQMVHFHDSQMMMMMMMMMMTEFDMFRIPCIN